MHDLMREHQVSKDTFVRMLQAGEIRPASLDDVCGTHHTRPLYRHPNTKAWFVASKPINSKDQDNAS